MPTITKTPTKAYAHCTHPRCSGNAQVEVNAIVEETTWLYTENGGDWPFPERSSVGLRFVNDEDHKCPQCGRNRDLSANKRPSFDGTLSGHDPNGLLEMQAAGVEFDPDRQKEIMASAVTDPEREEMQSQIAQLQSMVAELVEQGKPVPQEPEA